HTRFSRDWSSDVCSSDLLSEAIVGTAMPSGAIEDRIRGAIHKGKSVYHLDEAALARLDPDLILTQELCAVCAPSYTLVKQAAKRSEEHTSELQSRENLVC